MIGANHSTSTGTAKATDPLPTQAAFVKKAGQQLDDWAAHVEHLSAQADKLAADAKFEAHREVSVLKAKLAVAREKLRSNESVASEKWLEAKAGVETLWTEVKALFDKHGEKS